MKIFIVSVETNYVNCGQKEELKVDEKDLEGIPKEDWNNHVWEHLGGKECAYEMVEMGVLLKEKQ